MANQELTVVRICRILKQAKVPYMVVGAYAVFVHGQPRQSLDVDIVIPLPPAEREKVRASLEGSELRSFFWAEDPLWGRRFRCFDRDGVLVELFFTGVTELHKREYERRVQRTIDGERFWFISPEDLVLRKLVNTRLRKKMDYSDAVSILELQSDFDSDYIRKHCAVYRVCGLFEEAAKDAKRRLSSGP
jgi:hypothetical protein